MSFNIAEKAWLDGPIYTRAMDNYQTFLARKQQKAGGDASLTQKALTEPKQETETPLQASQSSLVNKIQETRNTIKAALNTEPVAAAPSTKLEKRIEAIETENKALKQELSAMCDRFAALEARLNNLSEAKPTKPEVSKKEEKVDEDDDSDVDLFGSDSDDDDAKAEAAKLKEERIKEYNERKKAKEEKKGALIAKSNIILDVKPWDDETDMAELEKQVRDIETDGLLWGAGKLVAVGYGIKKLQLCCVVEDDKVGTDFLEESICALEDYVQSVDIVAFNKI